MALTAASFAVFVANHGDVAVISIEKTLGSTPREDGAFMLVSAEAILGTIGGGQLEFLAIKRARRLLAEGRHADRLDVPLGPEIGQCCGGRVLVRLERLTASRADTLCDRLAAAADRRCLVHVYGAGHVGQALARALALLPLRVLVVDTRAAELEGLPSQVMTRIAAMPESLARTAPTGTSHVIVTHDHALDFMIAREALARSDAPYVGMIGSRTKRNSFRSWYLAEGGTAEGFSRLVCPIGAQGLGDKRPEVIAALAAAEILVHIGRGEADVSRAQADQSGVGVHD